jgi:hypothetical protein
MNSARLILQSSCLQHMVFILIILESMVETVVSNVDRLRASTDVPTHAYCRAGRAGIFGSGGIQQDKFT